MNVIEMPKVNELELLEFVQSIPQGERGEFMAEVCEDLMNSETSGAHRRRAFKMISDVGLRLADREESDWEAQKPIKKDEMKHLLRRLTGIELN